jgi:hypothetical protein
MTNKERLISLMGFSPDGNAVDGALIDAGITGSDAYDGSNSDDLKTVAIDLMELLLTTPDTTNETGFLIKYDRAMVLARISQLKTDLGLVQVDVGVTITAKSLW